MKCCLNSRMPIEYLAKVDEIKVEARDYKILPDLFEQFPNKDIILDMTLTANEIDWEELIRDNILSKGKLILCLSKIKDCTFAKKNDFRFYYGFPIQTYFELKAIVSMGVEYIRMGIPLFFELEKVKSIIFDTKTKIRVVPNVAYNDGLPREDGVLGQWIRPEDLYFYEDYVDVIEFEDCNIEKEGALFRIYMEQKAWPGELRDIITNLNYDGTNRMLPPEITERRLRCGQRCLSGLNCRMCYRFLNLANPELIKDYLANKTEIDF